MAQTNDAATLKVEGARAARSIRHCRRPRQCHFRWWLMSDPLQTVWEALERAGCDPFGPLHQFRSRCPGHDGSAPDSLAVGTGADGRALLWCHVGCSAHGIVRKLDLLWADLFPAGHRHARRSGKTRQRQIPPIELALAALVELGVGYRCTRDPKMWVAAVCPLCAKAGGWPLWITEHERGRVGLSCFNGCPQHEVMEALAGVKQELAA